MGVEDLVENNEETNIEPLLGHTVQDLIDIYGEEAVRRGLVYMASLSEADRRFRNVDKRDMEKGYEDAGVRGDTEPASDKWEEAIEDNGLGLDGE